jgi:hypothetical protein
LLRIDIWTLKTENDHLLVLLESFYLFISYYQNIGGLEVRTDVTPKADGGG